MCNLEELTLYIPVHNRSRFVDGTQVEEEILIDMARLRRFIFSKGTDTHPPHVNTKRKIDASERGLTVKRVETQPKTFLRRVQTQFDMKRVHMQLEKIVKRVWTQFFYTTRLNAIRKKINRVSTHF
jgi:hypothetical protein